MIQVIVKSYIQIIGKERDEMTIEQTNALSAGESITFSHDAYQIVIKAKSKSLETLFLNAPVINQLQGFIEYRFKNISLLIRALTHSSFAHEYHESLKSYERLEFLGDSVVGAFITRNLFENFDHFQEGKLSKLKSALVSEETLSKLARSLKLEQLVLRGKGELKEEVNDSILCDLFESLIGAIVVDHSVEKAFRTLELIIRKFEESQGCKFFDESLLAYFDPKTTLQEITMKKFQKLPKYKFEKKDEVFQVELWINGTKHQTVKSISKKQAMKEVALKYLIDEKLITSNEVEEKSC